MSLFSQKEIIGIFVFIFPEEGDEESENGQTQEIAPPEMDVSKVIEYPGFTIEPPLGCIDVSFYSFQ